MKFIYLYLKTYISYCALSAMELATCNEGEMNGIKTIAIDDNVANHVCNDDYNHAKCNFDGLRADLPLHH